MLRFYADKFIRAYDHIVAIRMIVNSPQLKPNDTLATADFKERLTSLAEQLEKIGMPFTLISVRKLLEEMQDKVLTVSHLKFRLDDINARIDDELARAKFFCVESHAEYIEPKEPLFGADVTTKFPGATFDIEEAGKSLALGLTTASVFHLMRVLEIGLAATSKCLSIQTNLNGPDRNWGALLRKIKEEMERRNRLTPPGWKNAIDRIFFEEIHASLDAVRNVWRNATMHVEKKYTPEEADHILGAVRGFMKKLASRVDEDGQPSA
jgi:hypothetical protein